MPEQVEQSGGGNIRSPPHRVSEKCQGRGRNFCFTIMNFDQNEQEKCISVSKLKIVHWMIVGKEVGKLNGTPHLQGAIGFKTMKSYAQVKELISNRMNIETMKGRKIDQNYCGKEFEVIVCKNFDNLHEEEKEEEQPIDFFEMDKASNWQKQIIEECKTPPDRRTINWIADPDGGKGKSTLQRHLVLKYNALLVGGKCSDIKCALAKLKKEKLPMPKIILFNLTRDHEKISYQALEEIKDGVFFSGKYESGMVVMNPPHVYVFANTLPEVKYLTLDRWRVSTL